MKPTEMDQGWTIKNRQWKDPECNNGINGEGERQQLCLGNKETFYEVLGQTIGLEIVRHTIRSSVRIRKTRVKTLWKSRPPPMPKKRLLAA
jgi:hypothetical protein